MFLFQIRIHCCTIIKRTLYDMKLDKRVVELQTGGTLVFETEKKRQINLIDFKIAIKIYILEAKTKKTLL